MFELYTEVLDEGISHLEHVAAAHVMNRRTVGVEETPDQRADAVEAITRRKLAYALYCEDAYTYGAPRKARHEVANRDMQTYMLKADRIIGFSK